jgi:hypothetical protein
MDEHWGGLLQEENPGNFLIRLASTDPFVSEVGQRLRWPGRSPLTVVGGRLLLFGWLLGDGGTTNLVD